MSTTDNPNDPALASKPSGQNEKYLVLSEEERAKGFVRPLRRGYIHVGRVSLCDKIRVDEEGVRWQCALAHTGDTCIAWGKESDAKGCGAETTMQLALCETYARDPKFYGSTFCTSCNTHRPVGEFRWLEDGEVVGS